MTDRKLLDRVRKLLDRVRKLLAMAADTSSPEEAAIAARRAAWLMEQHHLSQAEVMPREGIADRIGKSTAGYAAARLPRWFEMLAVPVARLFDCAVRCFVRPDGQQQTVKEGRSAANTSGTALMVRRRALVEEFCEIEYQPLYYEQTASDAYHAGYDAGQGVLMSQGVGGPKPAKPARLA